MSLAVGGRNNAPGASYDSDWVDRFVHEWSIFERITS